MNAAAFPKLRVLVVDDDSVSRLVVSRSLAQRFEVLQASNGRDAVAAFAEHKPDAVLLDVEMPIMDGVEATRQIKALAGDTLVPVFLLSGAEGVPTLVRGLAAGADDFLPKPFDVRVFVPKLQVFLRLRAQQERILEQHRKLDEFQRTTEFEHALAGKIFERISRRADLVGLRTHLSSLTRFNGDTLLSARTPSGAMRVLTADLTGHGLVAAIASLPLSSTFYDSTARGEPLLATLDRANRELHAALPRSVFAAAAVMEYDASTRSITVLNAGLPPLFFRTSSELIEVPSEAVPLGVAPDLMPRARSFDAIPGSCLFVMSDGIVEREAADGEMFGLERVRRVLGSVSPDQGFDALVAEVTAFSPGSDDVTLVALPIPR
jgi:DNA-binding response OmpR family regulator